MKSQQSVPKVVVVGGGFAGIAAVKALRKDGASAEIVLLSNKSHFEYYPALYKLVTGSLAIEVSVPLRQIFPEQGMTIIEGTFVGSDPTRQILTFQDSEGKKELSYDYLVLALGSETNYFNIPGLQESSYSFKSVQEALRLKRHFCELMATGKGATKEEMVSRLHVIIVGGGPSGVELAGDLKHYLSGVAKEFGVDPSLITIDLIEASPRVLMMLPERVSQKAELRLRAMGINIFTNRALQSQDIKEITMQDMSMHSHTVIWTAGTRINPSFDVLLGVTFTDRKRVAVSPYLTLINDNHVFIAGDGAGTPYSGLAQTAIHNGNYIGSQIGRMIRAKPPIAYVPHKVSYVIPIGEQWALWSIGGKVFTGFLPWLLRSAIDFRYFLSILPLRYVFGVFQKGRQYRQSKTHCPIDTQTQQ